MTFYFNLVSLFTLLISVRCLQILGFCPAFSSVRQALLSSLKSYYSDCSSAKFIILALNLKSCTSNIIFIWPWTNRLVSRHRPPQSVRTCPFDLDPVIWPVDLCRILHSNRTFVFFPRLLVFLSHRQINELVINPESFFYFWEWRFFGRERKREIGFTLGQWEERRPAFEKEKIKMFQDREKNMNSWLPIIEHSKNPDSHCKQILSNRIDRLIDKQGSKDSTRVQRINIWT